MYTKIYIYLNVDIKIKKVNIKSNNSMGRKVDKQDSGTRSVSLHQEQTPQLQGKKENNHL